jgi:DNA invertase Pin-like site-specific DNA recombinase
MSDSQSKVTADHLRRDAYLYVRQSTLYQVAHNTESSRRQYDLRGRAVALGWPAERVIVIDVDQGQSGASAADREGFQRLVADVSLQKAGIVLGLECSRLARNNADWHRLIELCALTSTLICDEDGLYDPTAINDRLLLGIKGTLSEAELHFIRARLQGGLLAKAARGELRVRLPVGLVYDPLGAVVLDPDAEVREAIGYLLESFEKTGRRMPWSSSSPRSGCGSPAGTWAGRTTARPTGSRCATTTSCSCCTTRATPAPTSTAAANSSPTSTGARAPCTSRVISGRC